jgi:hypothetical protein
MTFLNRTWPTWAPRLLWPRRECPVCTSHEFKPAEVRPFDWMLGLLLMRPVRCAFCWRRYYWFTVQNASAS